MSNSYKTEQEFFWAGGFGNDYIDRNNSDVIVASNLNLFSKILDLTCGVESIIEFGSNIGLNLRALKLLLPETKDISAIEINPEAVKVMKQNKDIKNVYEGSIFDINIDYQRDFVLIKGVLIHINPDMLELVYELLYKASKKYICMAEYYNPTPVELAYREHNNKLFKRDFAGEFMDKYDDLKLVDYGFVYHRDNNHPQDDITWFLLEKNQI